ncbi:MAG: recombinase family protein, partial [Hydrotalea sp. AMD]|uniref:helix-turn-helix domain-containing protein n=1 Tax=Hydrotalea sp. AMD TaxID=2501297 RepID=UPI001025953F
DMLGVFAEFETNLRKERQREGILAAKAKGVYRGRKKAVDTGKIKELRENGLGPSEIAKQLGISRTTVYRVFSDLSEDN